MEDLDTFDNEQVIEAPVDGAKEKPENPEDDTFDNDYYEDDPSKFENLDKNNQTKKLDEEVDGEKKPEEKKPEDKKEDTKEDKQEDEKKPEPKPEEVNKVDDKSKTIKLKDGDEDVKISPEATIKVKVNGKNEFVTIEDLKSNYSGKEAWSDKINEANRLKEEAQSDTAKFREEKQEIVGHLQKIAGMLDKDSGDPLEALYYLLDMTGRDVNTYSKRIFDFMEEQVHAMSEMDDVEKELYWTNKKLDSLQRNQAAKADLAKQEQARMELVAKVDRLRESQGVSEGQYVQAHKELIENGYKEDSLTPEMVINYQVMKPFVEKALDLTEQFEDDLSDDEMDSLVHEAAVTLKSYPKLSEQDALIMSAKKLGFDVETVDDDIEELNRKIGNREDIDNKPNLKAGRKLDEGEIESFDDFDF